MEQSIDQNEGAFVELSDSSEDLNLKVSIDAPFLVEDSTELNVKPAELGLLKQNPLENNADFADYFVSAACGSLAVVMDRFFVGEFSFDRGSEWSTEHVNSFVRSIAKLTGCKSKDLEKCIAYLEDKFGLASDKLEMEFGGTRQHHLRDFAHHPTPVGLAFSVLTQFTGKAYGTDTFGKFIIEDVKDKTLIGKNTPEKLFLGTVYWFFHMVSDMAGSSATAGKGCGLPGPLLSLVKEISALPIFKTKDGEKRDLSVFASKLYNGTFLADRNEKGNIIKARRFDLRAEIGIMEEITREIIPVLLVECIVRAFYSIRRFVYEIKRCNVQSIDELDKLDWEVVKPYKNKTIKRMLTVATGAFTACDIADAAIEAGVEHVGQGNAGDYIKSMLLKVNVAGVGRFAIALVSDIKATKGGNQVAEVQREKPAAKLQEWFKCRYTEIKVLGEKADSYLSACTLIQKTRENYDRAKVLITAITVINAGNPLGCITAMYGVYKKIAAAEKELKEARENRIQVEISCAETIQLIQQKRDEMRELTESYFGERYPVIAAGMDAMEQAILLEDADQFMAGNAKLQELLGHEVQFESQQEFDDLMLGDVAFKL